VDKRSDDGTGEVESLRGRVSVRKMGDRAQRSQPKALTEEREKLAAAKKKKEEEDAQKAARKAYASVMDDFEGLLYKPKTKEARANYELILSFIQQYLGEQPQVSYSPPHPPLFACIIIKKRTC